MTEVEWMRCRDPQRMFRSLNMRWRAATRQGRKVNLERIRLFACACCRRNWSVLSEDTRKALEMLECYPQSSSSLRSIRKQCNTLRRDDVSSPNVSARFIAWATGLAHSAVYEASEENPNLAAKSHLSAARAAGALEKATAVAGTAADRFISGSRINWNRVSSKEFAYQADLLREIVNNPFRPISLDPTWRTPSVLALVQAAYEGRSLPAGTLELDRLAVLADALEDAGCDNADILQHCRSEGPHVRGCWAVDLILGKS